MDISNYDVSYFYQKIKGKVLVTVIEFDLDEIVEEQRLKLAVSKAMDYYPNLKIKPYFNDKLQVAFEKWDGEVFVSEYDGKSALLGTAETNYYLFKASYYGNTIRVSMSHVLGDGNTLKSFVSRIVDCYYENEKIEGADSNFEYLDRTEPLADILKKLEADIPIEEPKEAKTPEKETFIEPEPYEYYGTDKTCYREIVFDQEEFVKEIKSKNTTPAVFLIMLIAQAMHECYEVGDRAVEVCYAMDCRKAFDCNSQCNFAIDENVSYLPEWNELPFDDRIANIRNIMTINGQMNNMLYHARQAMNDVELFVCYNNLKVMELANNKLEEQTIHKSAFLSSMGRVSFPEHVKSHIVGGRMYVNPMKRDTNFHVMSFEKRGSFMMASSKNNDRLAETLLKLFESYNISCELKETSIASLDTIDFSQIERK